MKCIPSAIFAVLSLLSSAAVGLGDEIRPQWIVVSAPAFRKALEPLIAERTKQGFAVTTLLTTDILTPEQIQRWDGRALRERLIELSKKSTGKSYILFVGPMRSEGKDWQAMVVPGLPGTIGRMKGVASDNAFGCVGDDLLPTIAVGRLPARTVEQARGMVEKILAYEKDGQSEPWRRSLTLLIGDPGGSSAAERALANWYVNSAATMTGQQINPLWKLKSIFHIPTSPLYVPDEKLHEQALDYLGAGQSFWFYLGHSSPGGFWSNNARLLDHEDFERMNIPRSAGIFITCGCWALYQDSESREKSDGYGFAAVRNPNGPVAVIGGSGESYAAAGQLAFAGLLRHMGESKLPQRLGELFLAMKDGLANGPMDFFTFKMFDYSDGSHGKIPLATQRLEHLEMWMLLGDPAMRLPAVEPELTVEAPQSAAPGATIRVSGSTFGFKNTPFRITVERPFGTTPEKVEPIPEAPPEARTRAILANHVKANDTALMSIETNPTGERFEALITLPANLPWPQLILRVSAEYKGSRAMGVCVVRVEQAQGK